MNQPLSPDVLRQAAEWLVHLDHHADAATEQAFNAWLASDPRHPQGIARLQGHLAPLTQAPARAALRRTRQPRTNVIKPLAPCCWASPPCPPTSTANAAIWWQT